MAVARGARGIAVATGVFCRPELEAAAADVVPDSLAEVAAFMAVLGSVRELGPVPARP